MKLLVIFLAWAVAIASATTEKTGDPDHIITNGSPAYEGQAPYVVGMAFGQSNIWCSGTIIGDTWILTSAQCLVGSSGVTIYFGATKLSQAQFTVTVGSSEYVTGSQHLALVRIPRIGFSNRVNRVALPSLSNRSQRYENWWAGVCGWGVTTFNNGLTDWLQCVDLQIMTNSECTSFYGSTTVSDQILCTRTPNGRSTCFGDAGSPLVTKQGSTLVGISAFVASNGCTLGLPAGFARITSALDWIRQRTGISY
ncbi:serine protease 1 [Drosophila rhopaloa]|uniref:Peptidase S1 domain-containing protein n=1 Tax=Drosophila rhopaloa TaxID=1041015 RepID=A0ABM5H7J0_DRORH|nr:serine protease 1 [Drosophila rhopaloa]